MYNEKDVKAAMQSALDHLKQDLKSVRSNRANPAMLDGVMIEVYGTQMRLKDIANITVPEPRQLLITPYDAHNSSAIGKAIENAKINLQPIVDSNLVRINIPPMDASVRKEMVRVCKKKAEEGKIAIREVRRKYNEEVKKDKSSGVITEDMQKQYEKKIQEFTDKFCKEIDNICNDKEKEILEI